MPRKKSKTHYTVVGMNPPGEGASLRDDSFVEWVNAHSPQTAVKKALCQRMEKTHFIEDEMCVIAVFKGRLADCHQDEQEAIAS